MPCLNKLLFGWPAYIVRHHNSEQSFVGGVDGDIERGGLKQDEQGVKDDVGDGEQEVRDDTNVLALP